MSLVYDLVYQSVNGLENPCVYMIDREGVSLRKENFGMQASADRFHSGGIGMINFRLYDGASHVWPERVTKVGEYLDDFKAIYESEAFKKLEEQENVEWNISGRSTGS